MLLLQVMPAPLQIPPPPVASEQHGPPRSPHLAQVPAVHLVPAAVHVPLPGLAPQQGSPGPPQPPHAPALQIPLPRPTHAPPGAMQIPETQHPPPLHPLLAQHCVPGSPQVAPLLPPCAPPPTPDPPLLETPPPPWLPPPPVRPWAPPVPAGVPPSSCAPASIPVLDPPQAESDAPPASRNALTRRERFFERTRHPRSIVAKQDDATWIHAMISLRREERTGLYATGPRRIPGLGAYTIGHCRGMDFAPPCGRAWTTPGAFEERGLVKTD